MLLGYGDRNSLKVANAIFALIRTREAMEKDAFPDFYAITSDEIKLGHDLKLSEMWPQAVSFLAAGGFPIAATTSAAFFYLSRYPDCYARLASEIRDTFASADEIQPGPKMSSCKYLHACLEEAMRCSPATLTVLWRQQDPADDSGEPFVVDGHVIPRGVQVGISLYSLFHNEDIFNDPFTYRPERWLDSSANGDDDVARRLKMRKAFIPFSIGDRNCPGKTMAWIEMNMIIARTLWYFDFESCPGGLGELGEVLHPRPNGNGFIPEYKSRDAFAMEHDGPNLMFTPRREFTDEILQVVD